MNVLICMFVCVRWLYAWLDFAMSSHIDPIGDKLDVQYLSMFANIFIICCYFCLVCWGFVLYVLVGGVSPPQFPPAPPGVHGGGGGSGGPLRSGGAPPQLYKCVAASKRALNLFDHWCVC